MTLLEELREDFQEAKAPKKPSKKPKITLKKRKEAFKLKLYRFLIISILSVIGVAWSAEKYVDWRAEHQWQFPIVWIGLVREIDNTATVETTSGQEDIESTEELLNKVSWVGKVSYYSHEGCIGCHPEQIMANGEKFDENAMTLAFNYLPLNTKVRVTNKDNGANVIATVTDTGGFEVYGRIADLSKGLMQELNAVTDVSNIKIEAL